MPWVWRRSRALIDVRAEAAERERAAAATPSSAVTCSLHLRALIASTVMPALTSADDPAVGRRAPG